MAVAASKLNKTMQVLSTLSEPQIDMIYNYAQFISAHCPTRPRPVPKNVGEIIDRLTGILPDEGKSLEDYRMERLEERYGPLD
ncbi:MAG: hypothetical protein IJR68_08995 [Fretibacterium sp.]|nr:hypothetical protein [Fretibacterium sp.]